MSIQMAALAGRAPPERSADSLGLLLLIPLGFLVLLQLGLAWSGVFPVLDGTLADPDSYMRLNRVVHLYESGNWFDSTYPRINPPDGHVQHWTRPLDGLLLAGAWLLEPFLGFRTGLHVFGVLFSPICLALTIVALSWASAPVLGRDARVIACLLLLLQPTVIAYASVGRADHHALLFLLFVLLLGATARLLLGPDDRRLPLVAGAVTALAVWVSPEALVFIAAGLAALSLYWLFGDRAIAARCRALLGWSTTFLALALFVERGPGDLLAVENDRLSIVHVTLFASIALFWAIITPLETIYRLEFRHRLPVATGGLAAVAAVILVAFPTVTQGPFGPVDPLYRALGLERILEVQPLIQPSRLAAGEYGAILGRVVIQIGIALFALPLLAARLLKAPPAEQRCCALVALALLLFLPLAVHQMRWSSYVQMLLVLPYAALIHALLGRIPDALPFLWRSTACATAILAALFWPIFTAAALPGAEARTIDGICSIAEVAPSMKRLSDGRSRTILAHADFGSELLYRTPHSVLSIPNHRPQPGFTATHGALTSTSASAARRLLARHGVDWILLCPSAIERSLFGPAERTAPTLYERLVEGEPPPWLRRLELPPVATGNLLLFQVEHAAPAGSRSPGTGR